MADTAVSSGKLTFNAEGNNVRASQFYSRVIHYPPVGVSGVTIGRGYDMGSRSQQEIFSDMVRAGVDETKARTISQAARLRGSQAAEFVRQNREVIGELSEQQQANLFNQHYPDYVRRAQARYNARIANIPNATPWEDLHPAIKDVVVDVIYQGFIGNGTISNASGNNIDTMIQFIRNDPELRQFEAARGRAQYLETNR